LGPSNRRSRGGGKPRISVCANKAIYSEGFAEQNSCKELRFENFLRGIVMPQAPAIRYDLI
jgi:hypothetical protein